MTNDIEANGDLASSMESETDFVVTGADVSDEYKHRLTLIEAAARAYDFADAQMAAAKNARDAARDELERLIPATEGEVVVHTKNATVTFKRDYRLKWDSDGLLERMDQGGAGLPDCVRTTATVDKRKYDRLLSSEQEKLSEFLTKELGAPKIKVELPEH